jgi:predicted transcriptional regulator
MGTVLAANIPQTLYVSIRRDELRELKQERDELKMKVAQLNTMLLQAQGLNVSAQAQIA